MSSSFKTGNIVAMDMFDLDESGMQTKADKKRALAVVVEVPNDGSVAVVPLVVPEAVASLRGRRMTATIYDILKVAHIEVGEKPEVNEAFTASATAKMNEVLAGALVKLSEQFCTTYRELRDAQSKLSQYERR